MLSREEYILMSMEENLFWLRIMKEHAIFIESIMPPIQERLSREADRFKQQFEQLLAVAIRLANDSVSREALETGQYYTRFTDEAEKLMQQFTGIPINRNLTLMETNIEPLTPYSEFTPAHEHEVDVLNKNILILLQSFIGFKENLFSNQAACLLVTFEYTSVFEHILHEGQEYRKSLTSLQKREAPDTSIPSEELDFWNHIMSDHSKVLRGRFDPTEQLLINEANQYAAIFDELLRNQQITPLYEPTVNETRNAVDELSNFKAIVTKGLIECKIRAILFPLFTDHLLREARHFRSLLG